MDAHILNTDITNSELVPYRVGIVPVDNFALLSYACTTELLRAANLLSGKPLYDVVHFGQGDHVQSSAAARVDTGKHIGELVDLDLLLVVAGGDPFGFNDPGFFDWLNKMANRGVRIGGVSGGPVILAKAGLLSGRRMTVHWEHATQLASAFDDIVIERRLYVIDRDRVTCGGGTAALDLMHALISTRFGAAFARKVSDWFLHTDIRAASARQQSAISDQGSAINSHIVTEAIAAMENHVGDPLSLSQISLLVGISERQLNRLFAKNVNRPAMQYYRGLRLQVGRQMLRTTAMTIGDIADATGFSNAGHFSDAFLQEFGIRPQEDRRSNADPGQEVD